MPKSSARVTDNRRRGWFWMHNAVLDRHGAKLGPIAFTVYASLVRRCGASESAVVSIRNLAALGGMSASSVKRGLGVLEAEGLIEVHHRMDDKGQHASEYVLVDIDAVKPQFSQSRGAVLTEPPPSSHRAGPQFSQSYFKENPCEEENSEEGTIDESRTLSQLIEVVRSSHLDTVRLVAIGSITSAEVRTLERSMYRKEVEDHDDRFRERVPR